MRVHDVSLAMRPDMPTWPGEPGPTFTPLRRIANGDSANVSVASFANHTGTHVDPPVHFIEGGATVDQLPIEALVGPCEVVGYDLDAHISGTWLDAQGISAERVLFKTKNSRLWASDAPYERGFVALEPSAAEWLVRRSVRLVGIDYLSIEPARSSKVGHPVHHALLGAGVVIVEGLDLSNVMPGTYDLFVGALKFTSGDGAPARVFLVER